MTPRKGETIGVIGAPGRWRWRWHDRRRGLELISNQVYEERSEAEQAVQAAYPDLPLPIESTSGGGTTRRSLITLLLLAVTVVGLLVLIAREA